MLVLRVQDYGQSMLYVAAPCPVQGLACMLASKSSSAFLRISMAWTVYWPLALLGSEPRLPACLSGWLAGWLAVWLPVCLCVSVAFMRDVVHRVRATATLLMRA